MNFASEKLLAGSGELETEERLIRSLRDGDKEAYEELVRTYGGRMLATARRLLRNEEDARDSLQDAFIQVFRGIDALKDEGSLQGWLHRIMVNSALMKLRRRRRRAEDALDDLMPEFDADDCRIEPKFRVTESTDELAERKEVRELVRNAIARLPDAFRVVLILRDLEGFDTAEVARMLEITPGAVKVRLHRARAALKKLLDPLYPES